MITRKGVGLIAVAIAVFFLASTTRVGWVHLASAALWGVILLSLVVPWISMPGMSANRKVASSLRDGEVGHTEGDELPVTLEVTNRWWIPRFLISVSYPVTVSDSTSRLRSLLLWSSPRSNRPFESPLTLHRRGRYQLSSLTIEIAGPFGLFRRRRVVESKDSAVAFPKWEHMDRLGALEAAAGESEGRRKSRTGLDTSGTRSYAPGDSFRIIHWRNSARSGKLTVREFDTWNDRSLVFAIDSSNVHGTGPESTLDYAARIAASASRVVEREGGSVSVITGLTESPDFISWSGVMEHLAVMDVEANQGDLSERVSRLQPGQRLMALFTPESESLAQSVIEVARRGVTVAAVAFEGFGDQSSSASGVFTALSQAGVKTFVCRPGELSLTVDAIETDAVTSPTLAHSPSADESEFIGAVA